MAEIKGLKFTYKGGPGSGNFGHAGRPGQVGGSAPGGGRAAAEPRAAAVGWRAELAILIGQPGAKRINWGKVTPKQARHALNENRGLSKAAFDRLWAISRGR